MRLYDVILSRFPYRMLQQRSKRGHSADRKQATGTGNQKKVRTFKILSFLLLLAGAGLVGFAYFGDLTPQQTEMRIPVTVNGS